MSGHPVLCGYRNKGSGWGTVSCANKHTQRPLRSFHMCAHICTHRWVDTGLATFRPQARELCTRLHQAPLWAEREGKGSGCGLSSPHLSFHLSCFTPGAWPPGLISCCHLDFSKPCPYGRGLAFSPRLGGAPLSLPGLHKPQAGAFPVPGIPALQSGKCGLRNQASWVECLFRMTLGKSPNSLCPSGLGIK